MSDEITQFGSWGSGKMKGNGEEIVEDDKGMSAGVWANLERQQCRGSKIKHDIQFSSMVQTANNEHYH